jgi:subtilisin family serine protease
MAKKPSLPRENSEPDPEQQGSYASSLPQTDATCKPFTPEVLDRTVIAVPLLEILNSEKILLEQDPNRVPELHAVIIDLNLEYPGGRDEARKQVKELIADIVKKEGGDLSKERVSESKSKLSQQYLFAELKGKVIEELVRLDQEASHRAIFHIWPDFEIQPLINRSISTVKANAAHNSFAAFGEGIVWAVLDSGIDGTHPHFQKYHNLELGAETDALKHRDFTVLQESDEKPLEDLFGHGTHVAAIIAGEMNAKQGSIEADVRYRDEVEKPKETTVIEADVRYRDEAGQPKETTVVIKPSISGMAPKCKLVSLKILNEQGQDRPKGRVSNIIAAIDYIQEVNGYGRRIRIQGVNLSVGYEFEPRWFACGQSPLCIEVNRLVKSGVVVVVAAGNTGYAASFVDGKAVSSGMDLTINDPGNADYAITVGSTHRDMPHIYGVSYFSSKGPTGDGRLKPDLVAPGEKIISADSTQRRKARGLSLAPTGEEQPASDPAADGDSAPTIICGKYREDSGTSMATPHVSGVIAAFLSVRGEFIGRPEEVKELFCAAATDLKRERYFQGNGLVDLMRTIQSV